MKLFPLVVGALALASVLVSGCRSTPTRASSDVAPTQVRSTSGC